MQVPPFLQILLPFGEQRSQKIFFGNIKIQTSNGIVQYKYCFNIHQVNILPCSQKLPLNLFKQRHSIVPSSFMTQVPPFWHMFDPPDWHLSK